MDRKIPQTTINNKQDKINIGSMGIIGKKETKKSLKDVYRNGSYFEMTEGEGILRVRNKNQAKGGLILKIKIWNLRENLKKENK